MQAYETQPRQRLGEILREWRVITEAQRTEALARQAQVNAEVQRQKRSPELVRSGQVGMEVRLGRVLVDLGCATDVQVARALATQFGVDFVDLDQLGAINPDHLGLLPVDLIRKYHVLPLEKRAGRLRVLVHDPVDLLMRDSLSFRLNCPIDFAVGVRRQITDYIDRAFSHLTRPMDAARSSPPEAEPVAAPRVVIKPALWNRLAVFTPTQHK